MKKNKVVQDFADQQHQTLLQLKQTYLKTLKVSNLKTLMMRWLINHKKSLMNFTKTMAEKQWSRKAYQANTKGRCKPRKVTVI